MDYDDDFFDQYDSDPVRSSPDYDLSDDQGKGGNGLDPLNIRNPVNSYFFLSDDAQDEIQNPQNQKLRCRLCRHEFLGRKTDQCPICYGTQFSQIR